MAKTYGTSVRLDDETHKAVKGISFWLGVSMRQVIADAVTQYVESRPELKHRLALLSQAGSDDEAGTNE